VVVDLPGDGVLTVRSGRTITVSTAREADQFRVGRYVVTAGLAVALHQRGWLVLHGSAVRFASGAVAILGASGAGKSTIAGALYARGARWVTDDVIALRKDSGETLAAPGIPLLSLAPEVRETLGFAALQSPVTRDEKESVAVELIPSPTRLSHVYVLADAEVPSIRRLEPHHALLQLVRHSYVRPILGEGGERANFASCAMLAREVPVSVVERPRDLARLDDVAATIERSGQI